MANVELPEWAECLFQPSRYKALSGGRGGGKSRSIATALVIRAVQGPERILCAREVQKSIKDSVKRLLDDEIERCGYRAFFTSTETEIRGANGSLFVFAGLRGNAAGIKSLEGVTIAWVEEAATISQASLDTLIPTIRAPGSEIWLSWNPNRATDPVDAMFCSEDGPPPRTLLRKINYDSNPWFPPDLQEAMEYDRGRDIDKWRHVWLGEYAQNSEARVFKNWRVEDFDSPDNVEYRQGADFGFSIDPSVMVRCWLDGTRLYVDYEAYGRGVEIVNLPKLFQAIPEGEKWWTTADTAHPQFKDAISKSWDTRDAAARQGDLSQLGQVHAALKGGRKDLAVKLLQARVDADKEAGTADEEDQRFLDALTNDDPNDDAAVLGMTGAALAAIVGPEKYASALEQIGGDTKDFTLAPGSRRYKADGTLVAESPFAPQLRTVGEGQSLVEVNPGIGGPAAAPGGAGNSRATRNNNMGNLRDSEFTRRLPGYVGKDKDGFAIFDAPASGAGAVDALLKSYVSRGFDTPAKIIGRWAPPSDGNDTPQYAQTVASALGIGVNDRVNISDPNVLTALRQTIARVEGYGTPVAGGGQGGGARVVATGAAKERDAPSGYRWTANGSLEAIPGGPGDKTATGPGGTIDRKGEMTLRKEFNGLPQVKEFQTIRSQFQQIQTLAQAPNAQNDIAMIFSYMKMLDPTSVVREGEFATAQNATGIPDQWRNAYNKALSGERLNPAQRGSMVASAARVYKQQRETYNNVAAQYRGYAEQSGYDPKRIAQRYVPTGKPAAGGIARVRSQQEYARLPAGTTYIDPTGKTRTKR